MKFKILTILLLLIFIVSCKPEYITHHFEMIERIDLFVQPLQIAGTKYNYSLYGFPRVRVLGWSEQNKFAYATERLIEGRGGWILDIIIFDLVKNENLYTISIDSFDYDFEEPIWGQADYEEKVDELIKNLFMSRLEEINNVFKAHGFLWRDFDFIPYTAQTDKTIHIDNIIWAENDFLGNIIQSYDLIMDNAEESFFSQTVSNQATVGIYLCGLIISPFGNKIIIVLAEERFVFEGTEIFYVFTSIDIIRYDRTDI